MQIQVEILRVLRDKNGKHYVNFLHIDAFVSIAIHVINHPENMQLLKKYSISTLPT